VGRGDFAAVSAAEEVSALEVTGVSHAYAGKPALRDVTLRVAPGRFTALLGLNGAGKTTLFSLVTRLFDARSGRIRVLGHDLAREPGQALRQLGVVFQARTLDLDLTVMQNLLYHAALHGIAGPDARRRALEVLTEVDLAGRARDRARALSGGQMRRVEIARALLHHPRLLVLDEPTVGLDVASKSAILTHTRALVAAHGVAALWATHLFDEIEPDDDVIVLHLGRVLASGRVREVVAETGTADLRGAFAHLTGRSAAEPDAA
jgi:ABC-2 type transport system ATP-binding protein